MRPPLLPGSMPYLEERAPNYGEMAHSYQLIVRTGQEATVAGLIPYYLAQARLAAQDLAYSYRDFRVGAAIHAVSHDKQLSGVFVGANYKPAPEADKLCAETIALQKAVSAGMDEVLVIAVSGPLQEDQASGLTTSTLHPCADCRGMFSNEPSVKSDSLILLATAEEDNREIHTVESLDLLHSTGESLPLRLPYLMAHMWNSDWKEEARVDIQEARIMDAINTLFNKY